MCVGLWVIFLSLNFYKYSSVLCLGGTFTMQSIPKIKTPVFCPVSSDTLASVDTCICPVALVSSWATQVWSWPMPMWSPRGLRSRGGLSWGCSSTTATPMRLQSEMWTGSQTSPQLKSIPRWMSPVAFFSPYLFWVHSLSVFVQTEGTWRHVIFQMYSSSCQI